MSLWGKIFGITLGYLFVGGPWGILMGFIIGHIIDQGFTVFQVAAFTRITARELESIAPEFFTALFSVMGFVAKAVGKEGGDIGRVLAVMNSMGIPMEYKNDVVNLYRSGFSPDFSMHRMVGQLYIDCQEHSKLFEIFVELLLLAAMTDGKLSPIERQHIQTVCFQLDLSMSEFNRMQRLVRSVARKTLKRGAKQNADHASENAAAEAFAQFTQKDKQTEKVKAKPNRAESWREKVEKRRERKFRQSMPGGRNNSAEKRNLETAFAILNITQNASNDDIKQAYRRLTSRHHPDKLVAKGMPEEVLKMAEVRTREIRKAYDHIRAVRNF